MLRWITSASKRISALVRGKPYTVDPDHPQYEQVVHALHSKDADRFVKLVDVPEAIKEFTAGHVVVSGQTVYYDPKDGRPRRPMNNLLTQRMLQMMQQGLPPEPFRRFFENIMLNPSKRATEEFYNWLSHHDIPITSDGYWLGYKRLKFKKDETGRSVLYPDGELVMTDVHQGTIEQGTHHSPPPMERNEVDDNWGNACSEGYHVGSMSYVSGYGADGDNPIVIVKVHPKDVVTVPRGETNKCRVVRYEIIGFYSETFDKLVYDAPGPNMPITPVLGAADLMPKPRTAPPSPQPSQVTPAAESISNDAPAQVDRNVKFRVPACWDRLLDTSDLEADESVTARNTEGPLTPPDDEDAYTNDRREISAENSVKVGDDTYEFRLSLVSDSDTYDLEVDCFKNGQLLDGQTTYLDTVNEVAGHDRFGDGSGDVEFNFVVERFGDAEPEADDDQDGKVNDEGGADGADTSDDEDEDDDHKEIVVVAFVGHPDEEKLKKITADTDFPYFDESDDREVDESGSSLVWTLKFDDQSDAEKAAELLLDYRFVKSAVVNPAPEVDPFPISFDLVDEHDKPVSRHAVRNEGEEEQVIQTARRFHPNVKQVKRVDSRAK